MPDDLVELVTQPCRFEGPDGEQQGLTRQVLLLVASDGVWGTPILGINPVQSREARPVVAEGLRFRQLTIGPGDDHGLRVYG